MRVTRHNTVDDEEIKVAGAKKVAKNVDSKNKIISQVIVFII